MEIQVTEKLTIQSAHQRARDFPYREGLSHVDILDRGIGPSRPGRCVRFSPLSSPTPASVASEFICPKRTSVYSHPYHHPYHSNGFGLIASTVLF